MPLEELIVDSLKSGPVYLDPLRGMPLKSLHVASPDYAPIADRKLEYLRADDIPPNGITSMAGLQVTRLHLVVSDTLSLDGLEKVKMKALELISPNKLRDLSPLLKCSELEELLINGCSAPVEILRKHPTLQRLSVIAPGQARIAPQPVEKFWADYDAKRAAK